MLYHAGGDRVEPRSSPRRDDSRSRSIIGTEGTSTLRLPILANQKAVSSTERIGVRVVRKTWQVVRQVATLQQIPQGRSAAQTEEGRASPTKYSATEGASPPQQLRGSTTAVQVTPVAA